MLGEGRCQTEMKKDPLGVIQPEGGGAGGRGRENIRCIPIDASWLRNVLASMFGIFSEFMGGQNC
jgi:hypothetical protein